MKTWKNSTRFGIKRLIIFFYHSYVHSKQQTLFSSCLVETVPVRRKKRWHSTPITNPKMERSAKKCLDIFLVNCIIVHIIESKTYTDDKKATSLLDADYVSGRHVDICCNQVFKFIWTYLFKLINQLGLVVAIRLND